MESAAASSVLGEVMAITVASGSWASSASIANAIYSTLSSTTSSQHPTTTSSSTTPTTSAYSPPSTATTESAATATASSALDPTSLSHLARSLPTYLAAGAAVLGVGIIIAFGSWWWRRHQRQKRFESRFGNDGDDDLEGRWFGAVQQARSKTRSGMPAQVIMVWDPETGKGRRLTLDLPETEKEATTVEKKRERAEYPWKRGTLGLDDDDTGRTSFSSDPSRNTIRLVPTTSHPTPTKTSSPRLSPFHIPDKEDGVSSVMVERVHTLSSSPSPSYRESLSRSRSPSPCQSESELRLLGRR